MKYLLPLWALVSFVLVTVAWAGSTCSSETGTCINYPDPNPEGYEVVSMDRQGRLFVYCINCKGQKELLCTVKETDLKELKCTKEK